MDFAHRGVLRFALLDRLRHRAAQRDQHVAKARDLFEVGRHAMPGNDHRDVEREHARQPIDPAVEVAIAEPRKAPVEQKVAQEHHLALFQIDDDVAVTMRRPPIVQMDDFVRQVKAELVRERLRRRHDRHDVVVGQADALLEPGLRRIAVRRQLHDVLAEQHAQLGGEIGDGPTVAGSRPKPLLHRDQRLFMRQDRQLGEHHVAVGVIEVAVRVDQHAQRLAGRGHERVAELARQPRILLGIDDKEPVGCFDRAGVGIASRSDPGMDAVRHGHELRLDEVVMTPRAYTTWRGRQPGIASRRRAWSNLPRAGSRTMTMSSPRKLLAALTLVAVLLPCGVSAQDWPQRPVRILVPYAAGGNSDSMARISAQHLSEAFRQPFVVENRIGANGAIAGEAVARAAPDGHTLLWGVQPAIVIAPAMNKVPFDPAKDFAPISVVGTNPFVLVVNKNVPVKTVAEFIAWVKSQPNKLSYAEGSAGSVTHLSMALFLKRAGLEMTNVSYRGNAPALTDVIAGHLPTMFSNLSDALPHARPARSASWRCRAATARRRSRTCRRSPSRAFPATTW